VACVTFTIPLLPDARFGGQKIMNRVAIQKNVKADFVPPSMTSMVSLSYLHALKGHSNNM